MSYRIEFTERARNDINRLLQSLAEQSSQAADRLLACFEESLSRLEQMPLACGLAFENPHFDEEVRHLLFGIPKGRKYRALFVVRGYVVVILAIGAPGERPINRQETEG